MKKNPLVTMLLQLEVQYELKDNTSEEELFERVSDAGDHLVLDKVLQGSLPVSVVKYTVEVSRRVGNQFTDFLFFSAVLAAYTVIVLIAAGVL